MFVAILRASSRVSNLAAERRPGLILKINIGELLPVVIGHDKAGGLLLDSPRRREAARLTTALFATRQHRRRFLRVVTCRIATTLP
jgi:hypothetical protein